MVIRIILLLYVFALGPVWAATETPPIRGAVLMPTTKWNCHEVVIEQGEPWQRIPIKGTVTVEFSKGTPYFDPRDLSGWEAALANRGGEGLIRDPLAEAGIIIPSDIPVLQVKGITNVLDMEYIMGKGMALETRKPVESAHWVEEAYRFGAYPYYSHTSEVKRHIMDNPAYRGVLRFEDFARAMVGSDFLKMTESDLIIPNTQGMQRYKVTFDTAFPEVMKKCQTMSRYKWASVKGQPPRDDGKEWKVKEKIETTWVTSEIIAAYNELFRQGKAHSVEVWAPEQMGIGPLGQIEVTKWKLVAGEYGVYLNGVFTGESVFHNEEIVDGKIRLEGEVEERTPRYVSRYPGAGRVAVMAMLDHLRHMGISWMDMQTVTNLTASMGGYYIPRSTYLDWRDQADARNIPWRLPNDRFNYRIDFNWWKRMTDQYRITSP